MVTPPQVARPLRMRPFRALRLAPGRIGGQLSARAFARPYRGVAARLIEWERTGEVAHDQSPAIYLHEYTAAGLTVRGLVGALDITQSARRLEDVAVLPHEGIHPAHATELSERMAEMGMNPAPILLVHHGTPEVRDLLRAVRSGPPDHQFTDKSGQYHQIWTIRESSHLDLLARGLASTHAVIADGHHRYAAYWQLRQQHPNAAATDAGLAMLVDQDDTPLHLGAIHRVLSGVSLQDLAELTAVTDFALDRAAGGGVRPVGHHPGGHRRSGMGDPEPSTEPGPAGGRVAPRGPVAPAPSIACASRTPTRSMRRSRRSPAGAGSRS